MASHFSIDIYDLIRDLEFQHPVAEIIPRTLFLKRPAGTSRGVMTQHEVHYLKVWEAENPDVYGIGEFAPLSGLSPDFGESGLAMLHKVAQSEKNMLSWLHQLEKYPAVKFALETACIDLLHGGNRILFPSKFTDGNEIIRINGLIWMGDPEYMIEQINQKIQDGFSCLKLKVGAISFPEELRIIEEIRNTFGFEELEIRLDANGAFHRDDVLDKLLALSEFQIHSIEQPVRPGEWDTLAELVESGSIPIALDEELIGCTSSDDKNELLDAIMPDYLVLKPGLHGGFTGVQEWIDICAERNMGWWMTSALESNIGLNAIAQFAFTQQNPLPQGLGTGELYKNNIVSPLFHSGEFLQLDADKAWEIPF